MFDHRKELKDWEWSELVDYAAQYAHSGLLEKGGVGLRGNISTMLSITIQWREEQDKKFNDVKSKAKKLRKRLELTI